MYFVMIFLEKSFNIDHLLELRDGRQDSTGILYEQLAGGRSTENFNIFSGVMHSGMGSNGWKGMA